jgi:hypothetical protein
MGKSSALRASFALRGKASAIHRNGAGLVGEVPKRRELPPQ